MWKRSFVATTLALGDSVDDALASLAGDTADELVTGFRAPQRATRAAELAKALRDIAFALDEVTLR